MSVAAHHSPHIGAKRFFESAESPDFAHGKRHRHLSVSPTSSSRPRGPREGQAYVVTATTLAALRGLFPDMDEKVVANVLDACGDKIDAAIKRLGELRLTARCSSSGADVHAAAPAPTSAAPSSNGAGAPACNGHAPASSQRRSAAEWVQVLVAEMTSAKSVDEARARAARLLQAFEQAVLAAEAQAPKADETAAMRGQLADLQRDNGILKRAVAIQNARMQEAILAKDSELAAGRAALAALQERAHGLELANYSLALHLRQATSGAAAGGFGGGPRPPDVF